MKKLLILFFIPFLGWAQQYKVPVPKDVTNTPIYGGLGTPIAVTQTVTATAYGADTLTLDQSGQNSGRNYRSLLVYNPSSSLDLYVCISGAATCSVDALKVLPGSTIILDDVLMGTMNNVTTLFFKLSAAGSVAIDVGYW